ncbi:hypothetical protein [Coleofasciculus sp. G2-EDA-02]|uniref:hypothetical protein n=1 Tax=Coleofasciculus sp. G2-EDA-02 TaxID=3069529 RepID=UPI00330051DD
MARLYMLPQLAIVPWHYGTSFPASRLFELERNSGLGACPGKICRKADNIASCL